MSKLQKWLTLVVFVIIMAIQVVLEMRVREYDALVSEIREKMIVNLELMHQRVEKLEDRVRQLEKNKEGKK